MNEDTGVFIHEKNKTFESVQIILKRSRLRAQPRLPQWTKKPCAVTNRGFDPLSFKQETWDKKMKSPGLAV